VRVVAALLVLLLSGAASAQERFGKGSGPVEDVPLAALIVDGRPFDGKRVSVTGVLRVEFEGDGLYLTHDHYSHRSRQNAVWLSFDHESLAASREQLAAHNGRYADVTGVFRRDNRGHFGVYRGAIEQVSYIRLLEAESESDVDAAKCQTLLVSCNSFEAMSAEDRARVIESKVSCYLLPFGEEASIAGCVRRYAVERASAVLTACSQQGDLGAAKTLGDTLAAGHRSCREAGAPGTPEPPSRP
jgi:hypothetical protein